LNRQIRAIAVQAVPVDLFMFSSLHQEILSPLYSLVQTLSNMLTYFFDPFHWSQEQK
jgi:hypothetical protein